MKNIYFSSALIFLSISFSSVTFPCSRLLHVDPHQGVMVGRNMDWFEEMQTKLVVYPRGMTRYGSTSVNPLKWISQYGSIVATSYDISATDGMNEKGLAVHGLWLDATDYGQRNENIPGLSLLASASYFLDNFKTVNEAIKSAQSNTFQLLPFYYSGARESIKVHLALEDASGDSAIIEYIDGQPKIYHNPDYTVLTNDPTYDLQLKNLKQYDDFGGNLPIPGTNTASDRFVRAAYHGKHLPAFSSTTEAVAGILSVMQNVGAPFTYFSLDPTKIHRTIWRTVADLTHHVYYFNSMTSFTTVYAQLDKFSLQPGAPVMILDLVKHPELSGDITEKFEPRNMEKQFN